MQRVLCEEHGSLCFLKTGMRDGPNKGKSFYVCGAGPSAPCKFTQHSDVPASHCLMHEEFLVELQMLVPQESRGHRLFYRCTKGKSDGKKWCGNVPWQELKNKAVLSNVISQSHMGREEAARNPFKVIDGPKQTLWKQISEEKKCNSEERKLGENTSEERKTVEQRKHNNEERKTVEQRKHDSEERKTVGQRKHNNEERKTVEQRKHDSEERKTVGQRKHDSEERKTVEHRKHDSEERKTVEQRKHDSEERKTVEQRKHHSEERRTVLREHNREERKTVEERQQNSKERTSVDQNKHNREERTSLEQRKHDSEARKTVEERKHDHEERKTVEQRKHDSEERKTVEERKHNSEERKFVEQRKHDSEERKFVEQRKHDSEERKQRKSKSEDTRIIVLTNNEEKTQNTEDKNITKEKLITEKSSIEKTCMTFAGKDCRDVLWSHGDNHGVQISGEESYSFQGWREKALPTGMKIKKKSLERVAEKPSVTAEIDRGHADRIPEKSNKTRNEQSSDNCNLGEPKRATDDDVKGQTEGVDNEVMSPRHIKDSQKPKINYDGHSQSKALQCQDDDENEDVVFVCSQPGMDKLPLARSSGAGKQRTIPSFPGFSTQTETLSSAALHSQLTVQLHQKKATLASVNLQALPDRGERLLKQVQDLEDALGSMTLSTDTNAESCEASSEVVTTRHQTNPVNPFSKSISEEPSRGVKPLAFHELPTSTMGLHGSGKTLSSSQNYSSLYGVAPHPGLYGGRMTEDRLFAVRNATSEAIDHLHKSLESCPSPESTIEDPPGLKVPLLLHQKQALAWLLWRETQRPQGGILADDMGLGKTLTMLAVILLQKQRQKEKEDEKKLEAWISKNDSTLTVSRGTLIICPASLIHHWKKEVEKRVSDGRLRVYLYHGPNREKDCRVLAQYDIVVTTYSLLSKEIPVKKEEAESVAKDQDLEDKGACASPLLRLAWSRIILDEAHNIKNPKVQTSLAVCKLRASARWAVTGTPIQNNLLDMYSLLRFLRCSPFDEFKLWKNQVDNGSKKGGERLNILTKSLLLRRTKDQLDHTGKPLVALPQRRSEVHRLTLSEQEQAVYDVIFARSRSTLQSYLKRHEGGAQVPARNGDNPFERVAREFGASQPEFPASQSPQGSSTVHILSLLLRLRQCCCHLSLLKVTLDQLELRSEGLSLSLEEQLNALTLCELQSQEPKSQVSLNGTSFPSELFETDGQSTKISSLLCHLRTISSSSETQKSVIVSQWTSMLRIVALHLKRIGLSYVTIDGSVNPKQRMDLVEEFNNTPRDPQVMLVSLCAGGVGLNLIGGNHLFLLDMHWNPALEDQACDRIYRVGQRKDVVIHRFVCLGTVEEKISQLQDKKKDLAKKVLSGTSATFTKLTLADLRLLFGV